MKTEQECNFCGSFSCPVREDLEDATNCIFNLIIHENKEKILFYNLPEKRIFKIEGNRGLKEISFKEAIREIDIIPTKEPNWKKSQILKLAKDLGIFG